MTSQGRVAGCGTLILLVLIVAFAYFYWADIESSTRTISVTRLIPNHSGYLIDARDGQVYRDGDNLFHAKFDSSSLYAQLRVGRSYRCETTGHRVPFLSDYKDLIDCRELTP